MSHLTPSVSPGLVAPLPRRKPRLVLTLSGLLAWVKEHRPFGVPPPADGPRPMLSGLGARPLMAAAWYGSLGAGPLCLPNQPALTFDPGYQD